MRLVIDSNVWISALVFGGMPRQVLELCVRNGHRIVLSPELITEVRRILHTKFPNFEIDFEALLAALALNIEIVQLGSIEVHASRDTDDDKVIETAVVGQAEYIVSGDKDLLDPMRYKGIQIVKPKQNSRYA